MNPRVAPLRTLAVLGIGAALLAAILYYASTVDGRPPTVLHIGLTQHLSGDVAVALTTTSIEVAFSEPVGHASAEAAFSVAPGVAGSFSWSGTTMTFTPFERLPLESSFLVQVNAGVRDQPGNVSSAPSAPFAFETVGNPAVVASDPADGDEEVALDATIELTFSTLMDTISVERALSISPAADLRVRWSGERLTLIPLGPLEVSRLYTVQVGTSARDHAGTRLRDAFLLTFRTVRAGLEAGVIVPAPGSEGIAGHSPIAIVFDRPLDPGSVSGDLLTFVPEVAGSLEAVAAPGAAGLADDGVSILRFQPSGPLAPNTTYEVTLGAGLLGADGSRPASTLTWSFTTGAPSLSLSNQIVFVSDRSGIDNLWAMNTDGSNQRQLSAELSAVTAYVVAPDGRSFVVGDGAVLIRQNADGGDRRLLTESAVIEFDPAFSPDGATIVFGRAESATGSGLGLWIRSASGGDPEPVVLPGEPGSPSPRPSPTPAPDESAPPPTPVPLLRVPRYAPDGSAIAFVDEAGGLAILDLDSGELTRAPFAAAGPPVWLPDGSGILASGRSDTGEPARIQPARAPVAVLDPASLDFGAGEIADLRAVRLTRGATAVEGSSLLPRAARLAVSAGPRFAYVTLAGDDPRAGRLFVTVAGGGASSEPLRDDTLHEATVAFAPPPGRLLLGRIGVDGEDAGIWLIDLSGDRVEQLATEGWMPLWLP